MLIYMNGDLLESDVDVICHQVNCKKVMGSGIAKQIRNKYPVCYNAYVNDNRIAKDKLGTCLLVQTEGKFIGNLYAQFDFGIDKIQTDYNALENSIKDLMEQIKTFKQIKIGFPYGIGCRLGGGNWEIVEEILTRYSNLFNRDFYMYKLEN